MAARFTIEQNYNRSEIQGQIKRGVQANLKAAAIIWHAGIIRQLRGPRSGNIYRVPGTGRTYTASAPGESPATRTGDLRTSYRFFVEENEAVVGSPLTYALHLEKGTIKMAPRPAIQPAFNNYRARIMEALEANVI